jgi:hypothetical protein
MTSNYTPAQAGNKTVNLARVLWFERDGDQLVTVHFDAAAEDLILEGPEATQFLATSDRA